MDEKPKSLPVCWREAGFPTLFLFLSVVVSPRTTMFFHLSPLHQLASCLKLNLSSHQWDGMQSATYIRDKRGKLVWLSLLAGQIWVLAHPFLKSIALPSGFPCSCVRLCDTKPVLCFQHLTSPPSACPLPSLPHPSLSPSLLSSLPLSLYLIHGFISFPGVAVHRDLSHLGLNHIPSNFYSDILAHTFLEVISSACSQHLYTMKRVEGSPCNPQIRMTGVLKTKGMGV